MKEQIQAVITDAGELPALLTVAQVARLLQVSQSAVYLWVEKAESANPPQNPIPFKRLPGTRTIRFLRGELLAWLAGTEER